MLLAEDWKDYELIDTGGGEKLERWGKYTLRRPDPQAIWPITGNEKSWKNVDAHYHRSSSGGGRWEYKKQLPSKWTIKYGDLEFYIEPTGFKHTGLFPEQAVNWKWIEKKIRGAGKKVSVLNLFAYTGGATVAAAHAGAEVCHVDASKGMVTRAKENMALSKLGDRPVRFIVDDVVKFVAREKRRGRRYDAVIMDPPSYGRGPNGEVWKIEDEIFGLITQCMDVLTDEPLFFIINSYTTGLSDVVTRNMLVKCLPGGKVESGVLALPQKDSDILLPCGTTSRWQP